MTLFTGVLLLACNRRSSSLREVSEIGSRMSELIRQHRFEEAAEFGLHSARGNRNDAIIYCLVAEAYAKRARYETNAREESLALVDKYSQQSLSRDPESPFIQFNVALVFEYAGDIESASRCKYYAESRELLNQASKKSSKSSANALKRDLSVSMPRLSQKAKDANCLDD